jgi:hypothetical protein
MGFPAECRDFVIGREASLAALEITPNAANRFGVIGQQSVLPVVAGNVREQRARYRILLFVRQIAESLDCFIKPSRHA